MAQGRLLQALRAAKSGVYCGPLRLLAMEVYDQLNADGLYCNLMTGTLLPHADCARGAGEQTAHCC